MELKEMLSKKIETLIERKKDEDYQNSIPKQAGEMGIPYPTFVKYINGKAECPASNIVKIAQYYGVSTDYLLTGKSKDIDESFNIACDITRLSAKSMKMLHNCKPEFTDTLNSLLENNNFWRLLERIAKYRNLSTKVLPIEKWLNDEKYIDTPIITDKTPTEMMNECDFVLFQIQNIIKDVVKDGANNG